MNLNHLEFTKHTKTSWTDTGFTADLHTYTFVGRPEIVDYKLKIIGIDPGKNFGLSVIGSGTGWIINGVLGEGSVPLRDTAFHFARKMAEIHRPDVAVIEGASYGDRYGQVKLAEIRCGFALGMSESGVNTIIVPPKTPRKVVFGSGDKQAMDVWPTINHNAADSLCLALYPMYKEEVL